LNIASGCCGSMTLPRDEIAAVRRLEAQSACAAIGAVHHESLCGDLEIFYNKPLLAKVASVPTPPKSLYFTFPGVLEFPRP
jgi:hypothetical protein